MAKIRHNVSVFTYTNFSMTHYALVIFRKQSNSLHWVATCSILYYCNKTSVATMLLSLTPMQDYYTLFHMMHKTP